tara:strand:- start:2971 stop:4365 length:1395 start_codon:yes stop_codon:yes gene_type:complete
MALYSINNIFIDTSPLDSDGESRSISINGTPGSTFSLTIKDKNGRNILPYSNRISKIIKTAATASNTLELNNASGLEAGMVLLNDQRRNVKITSVSKSVTTNKDAVNETSSTYITISGQLTIAANTQIIFAKESELKEVVIPSSGYFSFTQHFPALERFKRTLKTAASSATSLTLDYTKDLEDNMKITGTGVDGNDPRISTNGINPDGTTITVSDSQTINDETELTFEMPDNKYDITIHPLKAIIGDNIPKYPSDGCDDIPNYSIYQYTDPIIQFTPSTSLANTTVAGGVYYTGKANRPNTNTDIVINMTATETAAGLVRSRNPRFSSSNSTNSDFSSMIGKFTRKVRIGCRDRDIVHLSNTTDIAVDMVVTGNNIDKNKTVKVKSITGSAVKLSEKQLIKKDDILTFDNGSNIIIHSLTSTLSDNGGISNGVCTVTGSGKIRNFGTKSIASNFNFDNFIEIAT